jgi:hypothetical protein
MIVIRGRVDRFLQINLKWNALDYALPHTATTYHKVNITMVTCCHRPLSEPCLRYLRTRLLTWSIDRKPFSAMLSSFVSTIYPPLWTADVSSLRATMCSLLSSSSITRLHWYNEAIRLPAPHLPSSLFSCPAYSLFKRKHRASRVAV